MKERSNPPKASRKSLIREENTLHILSIAEQVFAKRGYGGATTQEIADRSGLPKANIHYYFPSKDDLYIAVLKDIFDVWQKDAETFDQYDDPRPALVAYIECKMTHSFTRPNGSKVWANEIIQGAPFINGILKKEVAPWAQKKASKIQGWIDEGKILPVDPLYLLYMIWATTQHYADFNQQTKILNGNKDLNAAQRESALDNVTNIILRGVGLSDIR